MMPADFTQWLLDPCRPPLVMGVLNVTPDSFSDGGRFADPGAAAAHAAEMIAAGAAVIDVGGESTRPGAPRVDEAEQVRRVVPAIERVARLGGAVVSIDTTRAAVARAALDAGATLLNDVSGGVDDPAMLPLAAAAGAPIVLMHMRGTPATMQSLATYADVVAEVIAFLRERAAAAEAAGVAPSHVLLDPGLGFAKTPGHSLQLLHRQRELAALGRPLVLGTSRKGFLGTITGEAEPARRLIATAASVAWTIAHGAAIVRVHDVGPMAQVVRVIRAIEEERMP